MKVRVRWIVLTGAVALLAGGCAGAVQNKVELKCGEVQTNTVKGAKCVTTSTLDESSPCPVVVTLKCEGEADKSSVVRSESKPSKLCCQSMLNEVVFSASGTDSGRCEFEYERD